MPIIPNFNIDWKCPHCGIVQSLYLGDPEDITYPDVEVARCYSCKKLEILYLDDWIIKYGYDEDENRIPIEKFTDDFIQSTGTFIEEGEKK